MIRELARSAAVAVLTRFLGEGRPQAAAQGTTDVGWWRAMLGGSQSAAGVTVSSGSALRASAIFGAIKALSEDIAKLPLNVYEVTYDHKRRPIRRPAFDHPVQMLLNTPNKIQDRLQLKEFISAQAILNGNGVAWIKRLYNGKPVELHPVPAAYVSVHQAVNGEIFYQFSPPAHLTQILPLGLVPKRDVLHIMGTSEDGYWGLSPIKRLMNAVGLTLAMEEHGSELFKNGADPGGVLKHPRTLADENVFKRLRDQWNERYTGAGNRHKTIILEDGMSFEKMAMSSVDAQFIEGRRFQVEEVCRIFRIPPQKLMALDRATFNNVEHLALDYIADSLMPWLERWEAQISARLFDPYEQTRFYAEFDIHRLARGDFKSRVDSVRSGVASGVMTINEGRGKLDLDPVEDGDVRLEPLNMLPAGEDRETDETKKEEKADA